MRIQKVYLQRVSTRLRIPIRHANQNRTHNESLIVCLEDERGNRGYGECLPRSYVTGESLQGAKQDITERWALRVMEQDWRDGDPYPALRPIYEEASDAGSLAAYGAIDLAIYDLVQQRFGQTLASWIGAIPQRPLSSVVIPLGFPVGWCVRGLTLLGVRDIKIKVATVADVAAVAGIKANARLRIDANNAFSESDLPALQPHTNLMMEEPFAREDWASMAALERAGVAVIADDSLCSLADAHRCLESKAASCWNLRLGKNGGITGVRSLFELAGERNTQCGFGVLVGESPALSQPHQTLARLLAFTYVERGFARWLVVGNPVEQVDYSQALLEQ